MDEDKPGEEHEVASVEVSGADWADQVPESTIALDVSRMFVDPATLQSRILRCAELQQLRMLCPQLAGDGEGRGPAGEPGGEGGGKEARAAAAKSLVQTVAMHPRLHQLDVSGACLPPALLHAFVDAAVSPSGIAGRLTELRLSHTCLTDDSAPVLMALLCACPRLAFLDLSGNFLSDRAVEQLAPMLAQLSSLRRVSCRRTNVTARGVCRLVRALRGAASSAVVDSADGAPGCVLLDASDCQVDVSDRELGELARDPDLAVVIDLRGNYA